VSCHGHSTTSASSDLRSVPPSPWSIPSLCLCTARPRS
jgi:hypothetical protein